MGLFLKEALKRLCGTNQWAYAVFWKIGCQNPKLLIWEECHYEPSLSSLPKRIAGTERAELPFGEWEGCWVSSEVCSSSNGFQQEERVSSLINTMMIDKPFNIVGEGMVGRAAFTGNHQWILSGNYTKDAHPPEVLNEMHHQFSAGMQTVAVIPVLPHGVVQLGSSSAMMENLGFINDVKSLVLQLGRIPGVLLAENYATKDLVEKSGVPYTSGIVASMHPAGNYKVTGSTRTHQSHFTQASGLSSQLSHSLKDFQNNSQTTSSTFQIPNLTQNQPKIHDDPQQPMVSPLMKLNFSLGGQLKDRVRGAEVITSNSDVRSSKSTTSYKSGVGLKYPSGLGQSGADQDSLKFIEHMILSGGSSRHHRDNNFSASNGIVPQLGTNGSLIFDQSKGSRTTTLLGGNQVHGGSSCHSRPISVPCTISDPNRVADINLCGGRLSGVEFEKADAFQTGGVSSSSVAGPSASNNMPSKGSDQRQFSTDVKLTQNELAPQRIDDELFQALNIPLTHQDERIPVNAHIPDVVLDDFDYKICSPRSANATNDVCTQISSGDDLFDVLGMDFKNKLFNGNWSNLLADETHSNSKDLGENTMKFTNVQELGSDYYSAGQEISIGSIFSGAGTDHLLDAVVSQAQPAVKQNSDDNVSCRTTLTKISSSTVPSSSPTYGRISRSNHVHGEKYGLRKSLVKAGPEETSSFQSGCSREDMLNCSQTNSIYGSQISSWVEQGNSTNHESSVSTAYSKRPDIVGKSNRKRLKPGENPRPRPKDRQMIQDRVKELRDIVPNGAKCSIDALFERTIKHMLFLQSVTKHADKLKQTGESKIIGTDDGLVLKDNFDGGATWAFKVGTQSTVCPIIVEDLDPPRQMLVEMLCEEQGFFLEIADLIRGLGLTILKGVMEARNDKIWARFAVEANRDVTRVEIFMSLVHLLEQTVKGTASSANAMTNNMMVHHSFAQAAPIRATGRASNLQ
ncbi:transcription factor LHW [Pyrus x bretschneideri]|uniref:transcription factor LHW n=1 Tax=Pyrus x bretschneideri TaxID=225117 RepID=UPI0005107DD7|nr:transcription factor LHW [Pyrus x bretschneideri]